MHRFFKTATFEFNLGGILGKTGAFMIPIIERLIHKPNKSPITRVLVLTPTRELAIQNYQVSRQLAQFTNIQMSLSAGKSSI